MTHRMTQLADDNALVHHSAATPRLKSIAHAKRPTLLLVEHRDDLRGPLARRFRADAFDVSEVKSKDALAERLAAIAQRRSQTPDALVSDMHFPGLDLVALLRGLRSAGWNIPVLMISWRTDVVLCGHLGASSAAPFSVKRLEFERLTADLLAMSVPRVRTPS